MDYQLKSFANFLIFFSVIGLVFIFGPLLEAETRYNFKKLTGASFDVSAVPGSEFSLVIPKIGAKAEVFKNTNPAKYDDYIKVLKQGVAHAAGTGLPGDKSGRNVFLFAHSSIFPWETGRINPVFYLLNKLDKNDLVYLYYQGKRYSYSVVEKKIIDPKDIKDINQPGNEGLLILQTCWPTGTTWRRLLIYAKSK